MTQPSARVFGQMGGLAREIQNASLRATNAAAAEAKRIHVLELRKASGGDLRMSGVGQRGAAVNVRYQAAKSTSNPSAIVRAVGPVHLLERPIKPHPIAPRRRKKALTTPYGPRKSVQHPGVQNPAQPWARALPRVRPAVDRIIRRQFGSAFARGLR